MAAEVLRNSVPTFEQKLPPVTPCSKHLETPQVLRVGLELHGRSSQLCRSSSPRPSNGLTFSRRRYSKSLDSPYLSRPRMKRRGAISFDKNDATAEYIRYLGKDGVVTRSQEEYEDEMVVIPIRRYPKPAQTDSDIYPTRRAPC